jgi:hypothetical protein
LLKILIIANQRLLICMLLRKRVVKMSVEDISSSGPQNLKSHPIFSQNRQTVETQFNVAGNIIFGGYSHDRTSQPPLDRVEALKRYLSHVISANRSLQLQGIRSAGKLISIELEKVYVTLCTTATTSRAEEEQWLRKEADVLPGENLRPAMHSHGPQPNPTAKMELKVQQALRRHHRLVVVGDPGCGKTTLLSYLALTYARNWVEKEGLLQERLALTQPRLPILLPLRKFAVHLQHAHLDKSLDGPALLLNYLHKFFANQEIRTPADFFTCPLEKGTVPLKKAPVWSCWTAWMRWRNLRCDIALPGSSKLSRAFIRITVMW